MKNIFIGMFVSVLIILVLTFNWGYNQSQDLKQYNVYVENQIQRMFYTMVADVETIQSNLAKAMVTGTPKQNILLFTDLMDKCYDAQEKLTQLPINHREVSKTQKFLSQVGDLSMSMAKKNIRGVPLTEEDMSRLEKLHNYSNFLAEDLLKLQNNISENGTRLGELIRKTTKNLGETNENMLNTSFLNVEERMQEYPELIYDGPFSEHIAKVKPRLKGKKVSKDEARKIAQSFLKNNKAYNVNLISETDNTRLPSYVFELKEEEDAEESITLAITKTAGKPLWMLNTKSLGDEKLSEKEAIKIAKEFLEKNGFQNMVITYSEEYDGQLVANFAYKEGKVIVYTDLIKVKVSLEDGSIMGFEAEGYLANNHKRNIPEPKIDANEARNMISMDAEVKKSKLAIIPTEGGKEVLCYEFLTSYKKDDFLIYVNGENGEEEKILQLIIKEKGVLIM